MLCKATRVRFERLLQLRRKRARLAKIHSPNLFLRPDLLDRPHPFINRIPRQSRALGALALRTCRAPAFDESHLIFLGVHLFFVCPKIGQCKLHTRLQFRVKATNEHRRSRHLLKIGGL